jgi:NTP pyrophosphatase (non-canonical NTP hydrolase)
MSGETVESMLPRLLEFRRQREWEQFHLPKELATALSIEAGELLEHFLWRKHESHEDIKADHELMEKIREEVADVLIYLMFLSNDLDIDLPAAIASKLAKNEKKYPSSEYRGRFSLP